MSWPKTTQHQSNKKILFYVSIKDQKPKSRKHKSHRSGQRRTSWDRAARATQPSRAQKPRKPKKKLQNKICGGGGGENKKHWLKNFQKKHRNYVTKKIALWNWNTFTLSSICGKHLDLLYCKNQLVAPPGATDLRILQGFQTTCWDVASGVYFVGGAVYVGPGPFQK